MNRVLGTSLSASDMSNMLGALEISVTDNVATIPTFRPDIEMEMDIAEEIARLYGYDRIEPTLATGTPTVGKKSFQQIIEDTIRDTMVSFGLCEAMHYSFESPKAFDKLRVPHGDPLRNAIVIMNPLGEDFSIMRTNTVNAMLQSLAVNYNRRNPEAALFELSKVYLPESLPLTAQPNEQGMLTIGFYGKNDFFHLKGIVEQLLKLLGVKDVSFQAEKSLPFMHPGVAPPLCTARPAPWALSARFTRPSAQTMTLKQRCTWQASA